MDWKRRRIRMPGRFDPARWEVTAGIGVREAVLLSVATVQAIGLIFLTPDEALPFVARLIIALVVGVMLLGIALVPIRDKPIEYHLAKLLRFKLRPPGRVYRTAQKGPLVVPQAEVEVGSESARATVPIRTEPTPQYSQARTCSRPIGVPRWLSLDQGLGLILAVFVCMLVAGSVMAYVGRGGDDSPLRAVVAGIATVRDDTDTSVRQGMGWR